MMGMDGVFGGTMPILERSLDLRSQKHSLIVSNVTNADTPHYKAFDMMVEEELKKHDSASKGFGLNTTHPDHLPLNPKGRAPGVRQVSADSLTVKRSDHNTVDIDREMAKLGENGLLYSASAQILSRKLAGLSKVIKGGS